MWLEVARSVILSGQMAALDILHTVFGYMDERALPAFNVGERLSVWCRVAEVASTVRVVSDEQSESVGCVKKEECMVNMRRLSEQVYSGEMEV